MNSHPEHVRMDTGLTRIEAYRTVKQILLFHHIEEADRVSRLIISRAIGGEISELFLYSGRKLTKRETDRVNNYIKRRISGMPLQYAMKTAYFMGHQFYVDGRVLIPRQETELLVETALERLKKGQSVLDLCTGSGCIAVSLAALGKGIIVSASDKFSGALEVAKKNAKTNGVEDTVSFIKSDMFENISARFDMIVSNPPYISEGEYAALERHIKDYEPKNALIAGDGLEYYRLIACAAKSHLYENGELLLEIGCSQAKDVAALLRSGGFKDIACIKDYGGQDRIITAKG